MKDLKAYYTQYKNSISVVSFFHWLEGNVTSIGELAKELGYKSIEELRSECKKLSKS